MTAKICTLMLCDNRAKFPTQEQLASGATLPADCVVELPRKREFLRDFANQRGELLVGEVVLSLQENVSLSDSIAEATFALLLHDCKMVYCADFDRIDAMGLMAPLKSKLASSNVKVMRISH